MAKKSRMNINETAKKFLSNEETKISDTQKDKNEILEIKSNRPQIKEGKYKQRPYYISDKDYQDFKLLAVYRNTDASSLVREALKEYLDQQSELNR